MKVEMIELTHPDNRIETLSIVNRERLGWYFIIALREHSNVFAITRSYCGWEPNFSTLNFRLIPKSDFYLGEKSIIIKKALLMKYDEIKYKLKKLLNNDNIQLARQED